MFFLFFLNFTFYNCPNWNRDRYLLVPPLSKVQFDWLIFFSILQEKYLSEHNYDEPIDVDSTLKLLNFGDDYSKFIDSLSDEISDLDQNTVKPQRTKRKVRRSTVNIFSSLPQPFFWNEPFDENYVKMIFQKKKKSVQKGPFLPFNDFQRNIVIKWLPEKMLQSSFTINSVANCIYIIAENDLTKFANFSGNFAD